MGVITAITLVLECIGGALSNSLSLISDALHVAIDLIGIAIVLIVEYSVHGQDKQKKQIVRGWGGVVSNGFLFMSVGMIAFEALKRLIESEVIQSKTMIVFAIVGLLGNAVSLYFLGHSHEEHATHTTLTAHVVSDLVQSVAVVVCGIIIACTGWVIVDQIGSLILIVFLFRLAIKSMKRSFQQISP